MGETYGSWMPHWNRTQKTISTLISMLLTFLSKTVMMQIIFLYFTYISLLGKASKQIPIARRNMSALITKSSLKKEHLVENVRYRWKSKYLEQLVYTVGETLSSSSCFSKLSRIYLSPTNSTNFRKEQLMGGKSSSLSFPTHLWESMSSGGTQTESWEAAGWLPPTPLCFKNWSYASSFYVTRVSGQDSLKDGELACNAKYGGQPASCFH